MKHKIAAALFIFAGFLALLLPMALPYNDFSRISVMHEGRVKPLHSLARIHLKRLSGKTNRAQEWLAEVLFDPSKAMDLPVIKITHPDILALPGFGRQRLFSFTEVSRALENNGDILLSALAAPPEERTPAQKELLSLGQEFSDYKELFDSLTLFLPLAIDLPEDIRTKYGVSPAQALSYKDYLKFREKLQLAKNEQAIQFAAAMRELERQGESSHILRVIQSGDEWLSPWSIVAGGAGGPKTALRMEIWHNLARAYHEDRAEWHKFTKQLSAANTHGVEIWYNKAQPFNTAFVFYLLASFLLVIAVVLKKRELHFHATAALLPGLMAHGAGIAARIIVMQRPPVSTLYESILFASFIITAAAMLAAWKRKDPTLLYIAAGGGVFLQLVGFAHADEGETMVALTAVLNTNFWLSTHVVCVVSGYAFCILASFLAHATLLTPPDMKTRYPFVHSMALIALLFMVTGTILGGIWADQSWGRFWGWDPKENGALLIVLWLLWLLHGRISGQMTMTFYMAGMAILNVIVALSWFGVNLLNVGLHSYGFTDSLFWALALFIGAEFLFTAVCLYRIRRQNAG